jgi:hypothetical protein
MTTKEFQLLLHFDDALLYHCDGNRAINESALTNTGAGASEGSFNFLTVKRQFELPPV